MTMRLSDAQLKTLGERIRSLREERGMTQSELAEALNLKTVSSISKLENGYNSRQPEFWRIMAIAKLLDVSIDDLLEG